MVRNLREFDMAALVCGEEFIIVMPECEPEIAAKVAERLRRVVADKPFDVGADAGPLNVTVSIGVTWTDGDSPSGEVLIGEADRALYEAKRGGRNRVVVPGLERRLKTAGGAGAE